MKVHHVFFSCQFFHFLVSQKPGFLSKTLAWYEKKMKRTQAVMQLATTELETCLLTVDILRVTETQVFDVKPVNGTVRFSVSSCKISFSESIICQNVTWNQDHVKIQKKKPNKGEILYVLCAQSEK